MGNSHTLNNDVPGMVGEMVRAARPGRTVANVTAPGSLFLGERATDQPTLQLMRSRQWDFIVLQAQEYSTSGQFTYPTDGAEDAGAHDERPARRADPVPGVAAFRHR
jgi:hypothetical protein